MITALGALRHLQGSYGGHRSGKLIRKVLDDPPMRAVFLPHTLASRYRGVASPVDSSSSAMIRTKMSARSRSED